MSTKQLPKVNLRIPAYDVAMYKFFWAVMDGLLVMDSLVSTLPSRPTSHAGPIRNVPGPVPLDHELSKFQEPFTFHADTMKYTDTDAVTNTLIDLALKQQEFIAKTFIETINDVTTAVGNTVDAQGQPLSADTILKTIEMVDFDFDDHGNPILPSILLNPKNAQLIKSIKVTSEDHERWNAMIARKKEEWNARQRYRRLSRQGK